MINRFEADAGKPLRIEALLRQRIVQGDLAIATELSELVTLHELDNGSDLIVEGESDNAMYFILSGQVAICVNGREIAKRGPGDHVGEMAVVDPVAKRSAAVIATTDRTVVASISESIFSTLASSYPRLWRLVAVSLCERLRQRNRLVPKVNESPVLFVGSSVESLPIAREIQDGLKHDKITVRLWTDKVFGASRFPLEDLERVFSQADFAVLVVGPDDEVISRKEKLNAPRDNVIFELGMCMGALGRKRSFVMKPQNVDIKIPSDLLGLGCLEYANFGSDPADLASAIGPICNELRKTIEVSKYQQ